MRKFLIFKHLSYFFFNKIKKYQMQEIRDGRNIDEVNIKRQIISQSNPFWDFSYFRGRSFLNHIHWPPRPKGSHLHFARAIKLQYRNAFCIKICRGWRGDSQLGSRYELALLRIWMLNIHFGRAQAVVEKVSWIGAHLLAISSFITPGILNSA